MLTIIALLLLYWVLRSILKVVIRSEVALTIGTIFVVIVIGQNAFPDGVGKSIDRYYDRAVEIWARTVAEVNADQAEHRKTKLAAKENLYSKPKTNLRWNFVNGSDIDHLSRPMIQAMVGVMHIISVEEGTNYTPTITATRNGIHMDESKHYTGNAIDIRTKDMMNKHRTVRRILDHFGRTHKYTAIFEDGDTPNEHIHIQYNN